SRVPTGARAAGSFQAWLSTRTRPYRPARSAAVISRRPLIAASLIGGGVPPPARTARPPGFAPAGALGDPRGRPAGAGGGGGGAWGRPRRPPSRAGPGGGGARAARSRTCSSLRGWSAEPEPATGSPGGARDGVVMAVAPLDGHGREAAVHDDVLAGDER